MLETNTVQSWNECSRASHGPGIERSGASQPAMPKFGPCGLWYGWRGGEGNYHASWPVGDADKPAVLLHHGYTASRRNWERTAALLQTTGRYRVLLMECRGTGLEAANHVGPYNIQQYAADVVSLLDFLKLDTINFCGHSMVRYSCGEKRETGNEV